MKNTTKEKAFKNLKNIEKVVEMLKRKNLIYENVIQTYYGKKKRYTNKYISIKVGDRYYYSRNIIGLNYTRKRPVEYNYTASDDYDIECLLINLIDENISDDLTSEIANL